MRILRYLKDGLYELVTPPEGNIGPLDGLRALAIFLVVGMHVNELFIGAGSGYGHSFLTSVPPFKGGWLGVPLFFVLSGFLIGGQLWRELFKSGTIRFWRFIFRRGFRIWPLYYVIIFLVTVFSISSESTRDGLFCNLLFLSNYVSDAGPIYGAWSLATEEQFYIIAPLFLIFLYSLFGNDTKKYRAVFWVLLFVPLAMRYVTWNFIYKLGEFDMATYMKIIYRPIHTHSEGLIGGMLLANYFQDKKSFIFSKTRWMSAFYVACTVLFFLSFSSKLYWNFTLIGVAFTALAMYCLVNRSWLTRLLSHRSLYILSKTSFCIYLVHIHIIKNLVPTDTIRSLAFGNGTLQILLILVEVLILSIAVSAVFYLTVEKPFLMLRSLALGKTNAMGSKQ